ncbi:unnamed protein product [Lasius platythorax]|uniref:Uncharacterized protein n=1 Tax=Lasius platythorax TaxID=488582 RepID=A0AAV2NIU6_9HYME
MAPLAAYIGRSKRTEISGKAIYLQLSTVTWKILANFTKMRDYANDAHTTDGTIGPGIRKKIIRLRLLSPDGTRTKCLNNEDIQNSLGAIRNVRQMRNEDDREYAACCYVS